MKSFSKYSMIVISLLLTLVISCDVADQLLSAENIISFEVAETVVDYESDIIHNFKGTQLGELAVSPAVVFKNLEGRTLHISSLESQNSVFGISNLPEGPFHTIFDYDATVKPGESLTFYIQYNPSQIGLDQGSILVNFESLQVNDILVLKVKGESRSNNEKVFTIDDSILTLFVGQKCLLDLDFGVYDSSYSFELVFSNPDVLYLHKEKDDSSDFSYHLVALKTGKSKVSILYKNDLVRSFDVEISPLLVEPGKEYDLFLFQGSNIQFTVLPSSSGKYLFDANCFSNEQNRLSLASVNNDRFQTLDSFIVENSFYSAFSATNGDLNVLKLISKNLTINKLENAKLSIKISEIYPDSIDSIEFSDDMATVTSGEILTQVPVVFPESEIGLVKFISSDTSVLRLIDGNLVGIKPGIARLTAISYSNPTIHDTIEVKVDAVLLSPSVDDNWSVILSSNNSIDEVWLTFPTAYQGKTYSFFKDDGREGSNTYRTQVTCSLYDAEFSLLQSNIQHIYNNPLKINYLTSQIYVQMMASNTSNDLDHYAVKLNVPVAVDAITVSEEPVLIDSGQVYNNPFVITPTSADQWVAYSSDNDDVLRITAEGLFVASQPGTTTVSCTSIVNPLITNSFDVTVSALEITLNQWSNISWHGIANIQQWYSFSKTIDDQNYRIFKNDGFDGDGTFTPKLNIDFFDSSLALISNAPTNIYTHPGVVSANDTHSTLYLSVSSTQSSETALASSIRVDTPVEPISVVLTADSNQIVSGQSSSLNLIVEPSSAVSYVTLSSSDTDVISITSDGKIVAKKPGTVTLTAESTFDILVKNTYDITVSAVELSADVWQTINSYGKPDLTVWCQIDNTNPNHDFHLYKNDFESGDSSFIAIVNIDLYSSSYIKISDLSPTYNNWAAVSAADAVLYLVCDIETAVDEGSFALKLEPPVTPISITVSNAEETITSGQILENFITVDPPEAIDYVNMSCSNSEVMKMISTNQFAASLPGTAVITFSSEFNILMTKSVTVTVNPIDLATDQWQPVLLSGHLGFPVWCYLDSMRSERYYAISKDDGVDGSGSYSAETHIGIYDETKTLMLTPPTSIYNKAVRFKTAAAQTEMYIKIQQDSVSSVPTSIGIKVESPVDPDTVTLDLMAQVESGSLITDFLTVTPLSASNHIVISSDNTDVLDVNSDGSLIACQPGTATITVESLYDSAIIDSFLVEVTAPILILDQWNELSWHGFSGRDTWFSYSNANPSKPFKIYKNDGNEGSGEYTPELAIRLYNTNLDSSQNAGSDLYLSPFVATYSASDTIIYLRVSGNSDAASFSLKVESPVEPTSLTLSQENIVAFSGDIILDYLTIVPAQSEEHVTISVDNTDILKLLPSGQIVCSKPGTATIFVESNLDSSINDSMTVIVSPVSINSDEWVTCQYNGLDGIDTWYSYTNSIPGKPYLIYKDDGVEGSGSCLPEMDLKIYDKAYGLIANPQDSLYFEPVSINRSAVDSIVCIVLNSDDAFNAPTPIKLKVVSPISPTEITINITETTLISGDTVTDFVSVEPANAAKYLTCSSSDNSVLTVLSDNSFIAQKPGTATLTVASSLDNSLKDTITLTVQPSLLELDKWVTVKNSGLVGVAVWYEFANISNNTSYMVFTDDGNDGLGLYTPDNNYRFYENNYSTSITPSFKGNFETPIEVIVGSANCPFYLKIIGNDFDNISRDSRIKVLAPIAVTSASLNLPEIMDSGTTQSDYFTITPVDAKYWTTITSSDTDVINLQSNDLLIASKIGTSIISLVSDVEAIVFDTFEITVEAVLLPKESWNKVECHGIQNIPTWYYIEYTVGDRYQFYKNDRYEGNGNYISAYMNATVYDSSRDQILVGPKTTFYDNPLLVVNSVDIGNNNIYFKLVCNIGKSSPFNYALKLEKVLSVESLSTLQSSMDLEIGSSENVPILVSPVKAKFDIEYVSSDPSIIKVNDQGVMTAVGMGSVVITATSISNPSLSTTCTITSVLGTLLVNGVYKSSSLASGQVKLLYIPVLAGENYKIYWDDSFSGSQTYSLDVQVDCINSINNNAYFSDKDSGYQGVIVNITEDQILLIYVEAYGAGSSSGTFAVKAERL